MGTKKYTTVFGATGKIGSELLQLLSGAGIPALAVTRDLGKAVAMPYVEWMAADMSDPESLYSAVKDSATVFLSSGMGPHFVQEQHNVILAAKATGVTHVVKLSSAAADPRSPLHIAQVHGEIEGLLKASGLQWTMLQPNGFMQNWLGGLSATVREERKIYEATGNGKRAYIDLRDIAGVAYQVLANPAAHASRTYLLTGGEALNYMQVADAISNAIREKVTYVPLSPEEARRRMEQKGMPQWAIQTFLAYAEAQRNGQADFVSSDVEEILGRPARTVEGFMQEYADRFR